MRDSRMVTQEEEGTVLEKAIVDAEDNIVDPKLIVMMKRMMAF
jgi:hypothetical protein